MNEPRQPHAAFRRIEVANERRGVRSHHVQQRFDRVQHAGDPAKREAGGAEADDFPILGSAIAANEVDSIGGRIRVIERAVETLEPHTQVTHKSASQVTSRRSEIANSESAITNPQAW